MQTIDRYVIWNNKGGVGKSTITFHVASRYAESHPEKKVLVIDLCPQANSSMMLLGGGTTGENIVLQLSTLALPRTVVGYMSTIIAGGAGAPLPPPLQFLVKFMVSIRQCLKILIYSVVTETWSLWHRL